MPSSCSQPRRSSGTISGSITFWMNLPGFSRATSPDRPGSSWRAGGRRIPTYWSSKGVKVSVTASGSWFDFLAIECRSSIGWPMSSPCAA